MFKELNTLFTEYFFTESAIYIIVFSFENPNFEELEKNITYAQIYGGSSSFLLLVGTSFENVSKSDSTQTTRHIITKYPTLPLIPTSLTAKDGVRFVRNLIVAESFKLPYVTQKLSPKALYLEDHFIKYSNSSNTLPILTLKDVRNIASEFNIAEAEMVDSLKSLYVVGAIIMNPIEENFKLGEAIVLNPFWFGQFFGLLSSTSTEGKFNERRLKNVWKDGVLSAETLPTHSSLISFLLETFEILYPVLSKNREKIWLAPMLFSDEVPSEVSSLPPDYERDVWRRIVHLRQPTRMRKFSRLLIRMIQNIGGEIVYWKKGMAWLKDKQCAFVSFPSFTEIYIEVPTTNYGNLLLCSIILEVSTEFGELQEEILIPCNDCIVNQRKTIAESYHFKAYEIENLAISGSNFICCYCNPVFPQPITLESLAPDITLKNLSHLLFEYSSIQIFESVGEGGFGSVHRGMLNGEEVAVKIMKIPRIKVECHNHNNNIFSEFRREVLLMSNLKNQFLVQLRGLTFSPISVLIDYCGAGDLYNLCHSGRSSPIPLCYSLCVALDIARGMSFLHNAIPPIVHRDLKSPNVLLTMKDSEFSEGSLTLAPESVEVVSSRPIIAKIADFGLSIRSSLPSEKRLVDNPLWLAPEIIMGLPYSKKADVYSFGIIVWELFSRSIPFSEYSFRFMYQLEDEVRLSSLPPSLPLPSSLFPSLIYISTFSLIYY